MVAGRKWLAAMGAMYELMASGIRLEIQEMLPLARMFQDSRLPVRAARWHRTHTRPARDSARIVFRQICRDRRGSRRSRHILPDARGQISEALALGTRASAAPISETRPTAVRASPIRSSG